MNQEDIKEGLRVSISSDISKTSRCFGSNNEMERMATTGEKYRIQSVQEEEQFGRCPIIRTFIWHPDDIICEEDLDINDIIIKGEKVIFNPNELLI